MLSNGYFLMKNAFIFLMKNNFFTFETMKNAPHMRLILLIVMLFTVFPMFAQDPPEPPPPTPLPGVPINEGLIVLFFSALVLAFYYYKTISIKKASK